MTAARARVLADGFHDKHRATYGHSSPDEPVQLVNIRVSAVGRLPGLDVRSGPAAARGGGGAGEREAYFKETGVVRCPVHARGALEAGSVRTGPLIIEAMDTTIVVPPSWRCRGDDRGFITLEAIR